MSRRTSASADVLARKARTLTANCSCSADRSFGDVSTTPDSDPLTRHHCRYSRRLRPLCLSSPHIFRLQELLNTGAAAEPPVATAFDAAIRNRNWFAGEPVDPYVADLESVGDPPSLLGVAGVHVPRQAELRGIGQGHGLGLGLEPLDRQHGTEYFLLGQLGAVVHIGKYRRRDEVPVRQLAS